MADKSFARPPARRLTIALWSVQILLALLFGVLGLAKATMTPAALAGMHIAWAADVPLALLRFVGTAEILGAAGLLLPAATHIAPMLTPAAAAGFVILQTLAIGFHALRGETAETLVLNIALLTASLFILWGRAGKARIAPRRMRTAEQTATKLGDDL